MDASLQYIDAGMFDIDIPWWEFVSRGARV
jgi:hypothetical protein